MSEKIFIAVDIGGSHGRIFSGGIGNRLKLQYEFPSEFTACHNHENYCWNIYSMYSNILKGIKKIYEEKDHRAIYSIGIDCFGDDYGLLDAENNLIPPVFHSKSKRTKGVCDKVETLMGGRKKLFRLTGIKNTYYDTINQLYATKHDMPDSYKKIRTVLIIPDLFGYWMTGVRETERTAVSVTQLYNPVIQAYEPSVLDMLELPYDCFPPIKDTGTYRGLVNHKLCREFGSDSDLWFINVAEHDSASSVSVLAGKPDDFMFISSGTMSVIGTIIDKPLMRDSINDSGFSNETTAFGKIRLLKNILGMWILNECRKCAEFSQSGFDVLDRETLGEKEFPGAIDPSDDLFVPPSSPDNPMTDRIRYWCSKNGQKIPGNCGQIMASIYKGLALTYKKVLMQLENLTGKSIRKIAIIGGGSKNSILNQWTADYCGVQVVAGPAEASAAGNIIMQMLTAGVVKDSREGLKHLIDDEEIKLYKPVCRGIA